MIWYRQLTSSRAAGFTLMELMTVMVLVSILIVLTFPAFSYMRERAERVKCVNNLHNLYAAGSAYVTDTNSWPQIVITDLEDPAYAQSWIDAFTPYQISRVNWICASIQKQLGDPPYQDSAHARIDYIGSPFDDTPRAAMKWPNHPWFIERGNMHGDGNLIILTTGSIRTMNDVKKDAQALVPYDGY